MAWIRVVGLGANCASISRQDSLPMKERAMTSKSEALQVYVRQAIP